MPGRDPASGPPAGGRPSNRPALLAGAALVAVLIAAAPGVRAAERLTPETKTFSTEPSLQFVTWAYVPKGEPASSTLTPVLFYAGEWGWRPFQQDTASYLKARGRAVLAIESATYFTKIVSPEGLASDLAKFRGYLNERIGRARQEPVILVGFAAGAEIIPWMLNQAGAGGVKGVVLIAPDQKGAKVFRTSIMLKLDSPVPEQFDVADELRRMAPIPVVLMEGDLDADSQAKALSELPRGPHKYALVVGADRQFHDTRDTFFALLAEALAWIESPQAPAAPAQPAAPPPPATAPPPPAAATPAPQRR